MADTLKPSSADIVQRLRQKELSGSKVVSGQRVTNRRNFDGDEAADYIEALEARLAVLIDPPKHKFWGAGEPDCPREIKAGNGELHTLRCKVCGEDDPRDDRCLAMNAARTMDDAPAKPFTIDGSIALARLDGFLAGDEELRPNDADLQIIANTAKILQSIIATKGSE
jgi:hypothetical protein